MSRERTNSPVQEPAAPTRVNEPANSPAEPAQAVTPQLGLDPGGIKGHLRTGAAPADLLHALQRTVGNQAVQRILRAQSDSDQTSRTSRAPNSGVVQRASTFVPALLTDPRDSSLMIGEQKSIGVWVTNAKSAPKGTKLTWQHPLTVQSGAGPPVEVISAEAVNRDRIQALKLRGQAPGRASFTPQLLHQVPGEAEEQTHGPAAVVQVPQPKIVSAEYEVNTTSGKQTTLADRLHVGDKLVVRFHMTGVSYGEGDNQTGVGLAMKGAETLVDEGGEWEKPNVYRLAFRAVAVGKTNAKISLLLDKVPPIHAPTWTITPSVEMGTQDFLNACSEANTLIDAADHRATAWLASVSNAYASAWKKHTGTLKDQADFERLAGDLILGAALAFVPGGVGGLIGKKMRDLGHGEFMMDGVKDLGKWGLREPGGMLGKAAGAPTSDSGLTAYPTDPLQWQNQETVRIKTEMAVATEKLKDWQAKARADNMHFFLDFDPVKAMESSLTVSDSSGKELKAADLVPVEEKTLADQFEKGFWKTWLETYGLKVMTTIGLFGAKTHSVVENAGSKVKDRCEALGLPVDTYIETSRQQKEKEAADLRTKDWEDVKKKWGLK